ncbi:MAG: SNF2-related protein [Planctomycetota bacterium]
MSFIERLEWLETDLQKTVFPKEQNFMAVPGKRCPQCRWLEECSSQECFRCGYLYEQDPQSVSQLKQMKMEPLPFQLDIQLPGKFFFKKKNIPLPLYHLRMASEHSQLAQGFDTLISLPQLKIKYFKHQIETCLYALQKLHSQSILADEVGLGKTVEAGIILKELTLRKLVHRVLILLPAHLIVQWQQEMQEKFSETFILPEKEKDWKQSRLILSFSKARGSAREHLLRHRFDLIIVDEAHKLKNRQTKQYEVVQALPKKYVLFLSATPFHNRLSELYNLVHLVKPGLLGTSKAFNRQFVDSKNKRFPKNVDHLKFLLKQVLLRNRRSEAGIWIPPRRVASYHLNFYPEEQEYYTQVSSFLKDELLALEENYPLLQRSARILMLMTLQRELCSSVFAAQKNLQRMKKNASPEMQNHLHHILSLGKKITRIRKAQACLEILKRYPTKSIIFTEFKETVKYLMEFLHSHGFHCISFTGDLKPLERHQALQKFREDGQVLISTNSGGEGFNIQFAHQMINYDLPWNPMVLEQRIGRIHRLGQEHDVYIFNLSLNGTIESKILSLLTDKIQIFKMAIGELDLILGALENEKNTAKPVA